MKKCRIFFLITITGAMTLQAAGQATSPKARMESWAHHQRLKAESPFEGLKWRAVGPELQGGRIEAIACHPDEPFTLYLGPGAGNLWKSVNNGTTWEPIFEDQSTFAIGCIAIAPSDPDIVWVGTGEVLMARSSYSGTGIFKSMDGGKTWQNMGLHDSHHIPRVVIDPKDPDIVYAAALGHLYGFNQERGLFKTIDGGKTWEKVLYISDRVDRCRAELEAVNPGAADREGCGPVRIGCLSLGAGHRVCPAGQSCPAPGWGEAHRRRSLSL